MTSAGFVAKAVTMDIHRNGMAVETGGVGPLLRRWRESRHLSQLELALEAAVSARHISFLETGRAEPSKTMLLTLANVLDIPLRERNFLLLAAGYAPVTVRPASMIRE